MKLKYMIVGFVAGVFAAVALTAGASTVYEKLTAVSRPDYTLVVDGEKVTLKSPPKIIEGSTHLPLKEVADLLGKEVAFNSGTIELTTKPGSEGDKVTTNIEQPEVEVPQLPQRETIDNIDRTVWMNFFNYRDEAKEYGLLVTGDALGNSTISGANGMSITLSSKDYKENGDYIIDVDGHSIRLKVIAGYRFFNITDMKEAGIINQ